MNSIFARSETSRLRLNAFIYGSLAILLACLLSTALYFSASYLKREHTRAEISKEQLLHFFNFQYPKIAEELSTKSYESINLRVAEIAKQFGGATHQLVILDSSGACVYTTLDSAHCKLPEVVNQDAARSNSGLTEPLLNFDEASQNYVYLAPIYLGAEKRGYLYAGVSDPYLFYRGGKFILALRMFIWPTAVVILIWALWLLISQAMILRPYLSSLVELEKKEALGILAAQVAHDIRSPLVAMKGVVASLTHLDHHQRRIIMSSGSRIESIANDLLTQFAAPSEEVKSEGSFLQSVIESIVAEKRAMLGVLSTIEIDCSLSNDFKGCHVGVSTSELSRVFSNLMNNSIEALKGTQNGQILISVDSEPGRAIVVLKDNGAGMNAETLSRLRTFGGSYGKIGGLGMGVHHAKATVAKAGGTLSIESELGKGSTVTVSLPVAPIPAWCAERVDLRGADRVVILDDDPSIHALWKNRLEGLNVIQLTDPEQFDIAQFPLPTSLFLFDYEISNSPITGLEIITSYGLAERSILMTSHFENPHIQSRVVAAGTTMLPKFMIPTIEIVRSGSPNSGVDEDSGAKKYDLVLIDDDINVHDYWIWEGEREGKSVKAVASMKELNLAEINFDTPIYVDKDLGDECGIATATKLNAIGFTNIRVATGSYLRIADLPSFIQEIRGKDFPKSFSNSG